MGYVPTEDARERDTRNRRRGTYGLYQAVVVGSKDSMGHIVEVRPVTDTGDVRTSSSPTAATVLTSAKGDIEQPTEGDHVLLASIRGKEKPVVVGTLYTAESAIRTYKAGDRHIGRVGNAVHLHGDFAATPQVDSDPADPPDGAVWYRSDLDEYRGVENGTVVSFNTTAV